MGLQNVENVNLNLPDASEANAEEITKSGRTAILTTLAVGGVLLLVFIVLYLQVSV